MILWQVRYALGSVALILQISSITLESSMLLYHIGMLHLQCPIVNFRHVVILIDGQNLALQLFRAAIQAY